MAIGHFRELRVYQIAFETAMQIFELSKTWPKEERYALTDQIRRSRENDDRAKQMVRSCNS